MTNMRLQAQSLERNTTGQYECSLCTFVTNRKGNFRKHMLTKKHDENKRMVPPPVLLVDVMEMMLKHQTEMIDKIGSQNVQNTLQNTEAFKYLTDRIMTHDLALRQQAVVSSPPIQNVISQTTITNSHNKKFNLNLFLNEECKNAQNLTDFVKNVVVSMEDLEHLGQVGYAEGMAKILTKAFGEKQETERPMHCTDVKRETIYIRENDAWKKDLQREGAKKVITHISHKNYKTFMEWRLQHPENEVVDSEDYETWYRISRNMCNMDPSAEKKLVRHLSTITAIERGEIVTI